MKNLFILIILSVALIDSNAQEWVTVNEPLSRSSLLDMFFIDEIHGWTVGADGVIFYSPDGGENWIKQNSGTDKDITKIFFLDENNGWAGTGNNMLASTGGTILKTTDGGNNWTEIPYQDVDPTVAFVYCDDIVFTDLQTGLMIAGKSKANYMLKTTDGGLTWTKKDSIVSTATLRWYDMDFYDSMNGIVVGNRNNIQKYTTDGGETWTASATISDPFFKDLRTVKWLNATEIITLGEGNEFNGVPLPVYKSTDGGLTWIKKTQTAEGSKSFNRIRGLYFSTASEGIAVGSNGFSLAFIYRTTDGGETWLTSQAPFGFSLRTVNGKNNTIYSLGSSNHIIKSTDLGITWSMIDIKPTAGFHKIFFRNGKGFAVNRNGDVFKSENRGENWNIISSTGLWETSSSLFLNENTGFVHKENRFIQKTTDGGNFWYEVLPSLPFNSRNKTGGIAFGDENTGYAWMSIDDYYTHFIYKTNNAGETWEQQTRFDTSGYISGDIAFFDASSGFIAGPTGWIRYTTDGGNSWNDAVKNNIPAQYLKTDFEASAIVNSTTAWVIGGGKIMKSLDRGLTWEYVNHNLSLSDSTFYTMAFLNDQVGYIGCFNGLIIKTTDGGSSWQADNTFENQYIFFGAGINEDGEVFFGSADGILLKYRIIPVGIRDNIYTIAYKLDQNYPNPFNPSTKINFSIEKPGNVEISIYDILGRKVTTFVNTFYNAGDYSIEFNAVSLASGIYYYTLKSGKFISSKKMVLLK